MFIVHHNIHVLQGCSKGAVFGTTLSNHVSTVVDRRSHGHGFFCLFFSRVFGRTTFFRTTISNFNRSFFAELQFGTIVGFGAHLTLNRFFSFTVVITSMGSFDTQLSYYAGRFPSYVFGADGVVRVVHRGRLLGICGWGCRLVAPCGLFTCCDVYFTGYPRNKLWCAGGSGRK